jgi:hypothetical protein
MEQFKEFPKMARLSREIIITEKIDGTNAQVFIQQAGIDSGFVLGGEEQDGDPNIIAIVSGPNNGPLYTIRAGSRNKWITPGKQDNAGFAGWVKENANELIKLGEGRHFGEWWGRGIQRGYGMGEKIFSLFNVDRWGSEDLRPKCCRVVPELWRGIFDTVAVDNVLTVLKGEGSRANPGFMKPEGIIVFHTAANIGFKKTIEKDDTPKSMQ